MQKRKNNPPWQIIAILACFASPIILAYTLYFCGYGKYNNSSGGTIIKENIILTQPNMYKKWQIAYLNNKEPFAKNISTITQRWKALGKDQHRVHLSLLQKNNSPDLFWKKNIIPKKQLQQIKKLTDKNNKPCTYFIIDPNQNLTLCYEKNTAAKNIDKDLRKLLKISQIG